MNDKKEEVIKGLEELRDDCAYYDQIETKNEDVAVLSIAIEILKRTAQEVQVQEQLLVIESGINVDLEMLQKSLNQQDSSLSLGR